MRNSKCVIFAVAFAFSGSAFPDDAIKVCEVIPASDVESALAIKIIKTKPGYRECDWFSTPEVFANAKAFKRYSHKVSATASFEEMKKMGYTGSIVDDTPDLWCAKLTTPPNQSRASFVMCNALTKGHYFEIKAVGVQMTPEKTKALVAKMAARLP